MTLILYDKQGFEEVYTQQLKVENIVLITFKVKHKGAVDKAEVL